MSEELVTLTQERYEELLQAERDLITLRSPDKPITEIPDSFGDGLRRDSDSSYNRECGNPKCHKKIHHTNQAGICTDCYMSGFRLPGMSDFPNS